MTLPTTPTSPDAPLSDEERLDLQDALEQDKELRWLERDASIAERALVAAPDEVAIEELRRRHRTHVEAQARLAAAHASILAWLRPQFARRRQMRAADQDAVVFTREEFRVLSIEDRDRIEAPGRDQQRLAKELKAKARDVLIGRGWTPRNAQRAAAPGRAPAMPASAWAMRQRLDGIFGVPQPATTP
jgi:hypothetical protein